MTKSKKEIKYENACIYTRVSTGMQERDGHSLAAQESYCRDAIDKTDLKLIGTFTDSSSGTDMKRPGLQNMLDFLRLNPYTVVYIHTSSRLSRSVRHGVEIDIALEHSKCKLISLDFGDTSDLSETDLMMKTVFSQIKKAIEQMEASQIRIRVKDTMRKMKENGNLKPRPRYGQRSKPDLPGVYEDVPEEQVVISKVIEMRKLGSSYYSIAKTLTEDGYTARSGKPIHRHLVRSICQFNEDKISDSM